MSVFFFPKEANKIKSQLLQCYIPHSDCWETQLSLISALSARLCHIVILKQPFGFNKALKILNWKNREFSPNCVTFGGFCYISSQQEKIKIYGLHQQHEFQIEELTCLIFLGCLIKYQLQEGSSSSDVFLCVNSVCCVFPECSVVVSRLIEQVSHHHCTVVVTNERICPVMPLQLVASADVCICSVCVFAGFSWGSRQKWSPWPSRTAGESWSPWTPWDLPVMSQYKRRCKLSLHSASTLLLIHIQSGTVSTCPLHLHTAFAFSGICLSFVPLKNTAVWQVFFCCCFGVSSTKFGWSAINSQPFKTFGARSDEGLTNSEII